MTVVLFFVLWILTVIFSVTIGMRYRDILDRIAEIEGRNKSTPAEIVTANPRRSPMQPSDGSSFVVVSKSPRQLEREEKEEIDRIGGI